MTTNSEKPSGTASIAAYTEPSLLPQHKLHPSTRAVDFFLIRAEQLDFDAPYQRSTVWDLARRQNLMKSLIMGLPIGAVVLNKRPGLPEKYLAVVDGKQRLETLIAMARGEFGIPAAWVAAHWRGATVPIDFDGRTVDGIVVNGNDHPFMSLLMNFPVSTIEANVQTVQEEAMIFRLINTGGVDQTAETIAAAAAVESAEA